MCASIVFPNVPDSVTAFSVLAAIMICIGFTCCIVFLFTVNEVKLTEAANRHNGKNSNNQKESVNTNNEVKYVKWYAWFKFPIFYASSILYATGRCITCISMSLTPF